VMAICKCVCVYWCVCVKLIIDRSVAAAITFPLCCFDSIGKRLSAPLILGLLMVRGGEGDGEETEVQRGNVIHSCTHSCTHGVHSKLANAYLSFD